MSDDSVGGRRRRRRRRRWLGDDPGRTIARAVVLTAALYVSYHSVDAKDSPTVVNIRASNVDQNMCPTKCSGTLLSNVIVLTAATCSGPIPEEPAAGNATGRASVFTTTTYAPVLKNAVKEGDIRVYVNQPNDAKCRNVTAKYLHPEFNQHSLVANLALLRLKKPFNEYSHVVMPLILDSNMLELPTNLSFKGFGMINLEGQNVINDKTKLNDNVMVRTLNVNYSGEMCFNSVKGSVRADL